MRDSVSPAREGCFLRAMRAFVFLRIHVGCSLPCRQTSELKIYERHRFAGGELLNPECKQQEHQGLADSW